MPEWLKTAAITPSMPPSELVFRLVLAMAFGWAIAWMYKHTRAPRELTASFPTTLVLLTMLIALVTPVISGDVARAFSLVGALSIVRFRTVVRDTQDTSFVIFAVVVGMACGVGQPVIAAIGFTVVSIAAWLMTRRTVAAAVEAVFDIQLRVALGQDLRALLDSTIKPFVRDHRLLSMETSGKGTSIDAAYEARLSNEDAADELLKALNRIDGVQSVGLKRRGDDA